MSDIDVRSNPKLVLVSVGLVAALAVAGPAVAAFPKEGKADFTACWAGKSNVIAFSKTHIAFSYEMTGTTRSNLPDNLLDKHAFRCVGVLNLNAGKVVAGTAFCESVDKDGDKSFSRYDNEPPKVVRTQIGGTGKYEGMQMSLTAQGLGPFPTIKPGTFLGCNHQTGTYKLK